MNKLKTIGLWVLQALLAVPFVAAGAMKLFGAARAGWAATFHRYGYPEGFSYIVGAVEVLSALGLLVPRFAAYGAVALMAVMPGAGITHVVHKDGAPAFNLVLLVLLAAVAWARRPAFLRKPDAN